MSSFSSVRLYQNNTFFLTSLPSSSSIIIHYPPILFITGFPVFCTLLPSGACLLFLQQKRRHALTWPHKVCVHHKSSFVIHFLLPISELRCAATRARAALYRKFLCYAHPTSYCPSPNHVMPQLARELPLRKFLCYSISASHLRITLCRNSRENCCFESSFAIHFPPPISEPRYAATRVGAALY